MIIGVTGKAGCGKDTFANVLVAEYGFVRIAFADALKHGVQEMLGLSNEQVWGSLKDETDPFWQRTPRWLLQFIGTDLMREQFDQNVWVKRVLKEIDENPTVNYVVSDVRFPNEAQVVRDRGGIIVKLSRDLPGRDNGIEGHASESHYNSIHADVLIFNNSTLDHLRNRAFQVAQEFLR